LTKLKLLRRFQMKEWETLIFGKRSSSQKSDPTKTKWKTWRYKKLHWIIHEFIHSDNSYSASSRTTTEIQYCWQINWSEDEVTQKPELHVEMENLALVTEWCLTLMRTSLN